VTSNLAASRKTLRVLRQQEELAGGLEALSALLVTSAKLVDEVTGPDSEEPAYAKAAVLRAYLGVIVELRKSTAAPVDDTWVELLRAAGGSEMAERS
jgi:hypothetical protein